ncbi:hypothetical protein HDE_02081 [Halotydeus destructor]|nr:hypothetical protein HDE_02081 [Halotydeus destructor]
MMRLKSQRRDRKNVLVRIVAQYFPNMMTNSSDPSMCEIAGSLGDAMPLFPKILGFNCTAIVDKHGGPDSSGNHDGIIGHFQAGTVDFSPVPIRVPLEGDPISISHIIFADKISYSTAYLRPEPPIADNDLTDSFQQVENPVWLLFFLLTFLIGILLKIHGHKTPIYDVIQCVLQLEGRQTNRASSRILGWTTVMGLFILIMHFSEFMLSDLVRQEKPEVLQYFFDVLRPDAEIYFSRDNQMLNELQRSSDQRVKDIVRKLDGKNSSSYTLAPGIAGFTDFITKSLKSRRLVALFGKSAMIEHQRVLGCAVLVNADEKASKGISIWVPRDSPLHWSCATPFSKKLSRVARDPIQRAVVQYFERGMFGSAVWRYIMRVIRRDIFRANVDPLCHAQTIAAEDPESHHSLSLGNTKLLLVILTAIPLLASLLLLAERFTYLRKEQHPVSSWASTVSQKKLTKKSFDRMNRD